MSILTSMREGLKKRRDASTALRYLACLTAGVAIGCAIWLPGITSHPYHGILRLVMVGVLIGAASLVAYIREPRWARPAILAGSAGALLPVAVELIGSALAGGLE